MKLAWSNLAKAELQALRRYSFERWGRDVAQGYLEDVGAAARQLSVNPLRARPLKDPFRILRVRSHYLIVHVDEAAERLTIARVLHVAMDMIERHLPWWSDLAASGTSISSGRHAGADLHGRTRP